MNTADQDRVIRSILADQYGMTDDPVENARRIAQADQFVDAVYASMRREPEHDSESAVDATAPMGSRWDRMRRAFAVIGLGLGRDSRGNQLPMIWSNPQRIAGVVGGVALLGIGLVLWRTVAPADQHSDEHMRGAPQTQRWQIADNADTHIAAAELVSGILGAGCNARVEDDAQRVMVAIDLSKPGCDADGKAAALLVARGLSADLAGHATIWVTRGNSTDAPARDGAKR